MQCLEIGKKIGCKHPTSQSKKPQAERQISFLVEAMFFLVLGPERKFCNSSYRSPGQSELYPLKLPEQTSNNDLLSSNS
jgi:hypothetical protein